MSGFKRTDSILSSLCFRFQAATMSTHRSCSISDELSEAPDLLVVNRLLLMCSVSYVQLLLDSQLDGFEFHFELLTNGVARRADSVFEVCEVLNLRH